MNSILCLEEGKPVKSSITGTVVGVDVTKAEKIWNLLQALGNIAFAYSFSVILIEIQASSIFFQTINQSFQISSYVIGNFFPSETGIKLVFKLKSLPLLRECYGIYF